MRFEVCAAGAAVLQGQIAAFHTDGVYRICPRWLEVTMRGSWSWTMRGFRCALLCLALGAGAAAGEPPPDVETQWRTLKAEVAEAYQRGAYAEGGGTAVRA